MDSGDRLDSILDDLLDRALRGEPVDIEVEIASHTDLSDHERDRLRARAGALVRRDGSVDRARGAPLERIGEFRLLEPLGEGGMGIVYRAVQESLDREVAVKLMRPELSGSPTARRRFEREAEAIARLRHDHIVRVLAYGEESGLCYLAMELVPGRDLEQILRDATAANAPVAAAQAVRWTLEIARALECAHAAGVIHRDVKPSNVRVTPEGRAMLVDFGLVAVADRSALSHTGGFHGTPYFASPEQVDPGDVALDARTDVYSLGATLYRCVTDRLPFSGRTSVEVFHKILVGDLPPPRRLRKSISRDLETVILKAMERDRDRRYPTASAMAADLEAILEMRTISARPAGALRRAASWSRRNRGQAAAVAIAFSAVAIAGIVRAVDRRAVRAHFERERADADVAAARGDFAAALSAIDRAAGLAPDDVSTLARRAEIERERTRASARAALDDARRTLDDARSIRAGLAPLRADVTMLRAAVTTRFMSAEEQSRWATEENELKARESALEQAFSSATLAVERARALDPGSREPSSILGDLHMERWRDALAAGDSARARREYALVRESDARGEHASELDGLGRFAIESDPPGAEVFLFRYREQSEIVDGGEQRLVPVPVGGGATPVPPGTMCMRVVKSAGDAVVGDVVVRVAAYPIDGTMLVARAGDRTQALDRLVSIDGVLVRDRQDVNALGSPKGAEGKRRFEFERGSERYVLEARALRDIVPGGAVLRPDTLAADYSAPLEVDHAGELRAIQSTPGLVVRMTAAPLFLSHACSVGATPTALRDVEPGSYLACLRRAGFEDQRLPFIVPRNGEARVKAHLIALGTSPEGFVYVPAGAFAAGGDADAYGAWPSAAREVGEFWIQEREITEPEYAQFLDDPVTLAEIAHSPVPIRYPRNASNEHQGGDWSREPDGTFRVPSPGSNYPIGDVSWEDANAFAAWRTTRAREHDERFTYALPTEAEWEKAARGADARAFVYGNRFFPSWAKGSFARDPARVGTLQAEPPLRFPRDESVYGVFDLTGSQWEWCQDAWPEGENARALRGGARTFVYPANFRVAARAGNSQKATVGELGFRLVAHRTRD
jgi:formylglycine-generating enzyme required for sulfatase activity